MSLIIRHARARDQKETVDIAIEGGKISAVAVNLPSSAPNEIDAGGNLVLPGLCNLHYHADKCLLGEIMRPNVSGTLPEAIEITNDFKRNYDPVEVAARAVRTLEQGVKNGTTFFRLFCDVGTIGGLRAARGLLLAREKMKHYCRIQVVAFPQEGIVRDPGAVELMEEAIKEGCDVVGGLPWYEYTDDETTPAYRYLLRHGDQARSRHPHAGGRHGRSQLSQSGISGAQDHARRFPRPCRGKSLRGHGRIQRCLRGQGRGHGGDRRHNHFGQCAHQSRLLGTARSRAEAAWHC